MANTQQDYARAMHDQELAEEELSTELHQQRHAADYDNLASFDRARLFSACQDAESARTHLHAASAEARQALVTLLVGGAN